VCRHLSDYVLNVDFNYQQGLSSIKNIAKNLGEDIFDKQRKYFNSTYYNLFHYDNLGKHLKNMIDLINPGEQIQFSLSSENHLMALKLVKPKKEIRDYITLIFYDPNKTTIHKKLLFKNSQAIKQLRLSDLMRSIEIKTYFPSHQTLMLISPILRKEKETPIIEIEETLCAGSKLANALYLGWPEPIKKAISKILTSTSEDKYSALLQMSKEGYPTFAQTMLDGSDQAIPIYIEAVFNSILAPQKKKQLLRASTMSGYPALYVAMLSNNAKNIRAYVSSLLKIKPSSTILVDLLTAKSPERTPCLYCALERGHTASVEVYLQLILNSTIAKFDKLSIVMAMNNQLTSGLLKAIQKGHTDTVKAYLLSVLHSNLDEPTKISLLMIKYKGKLPSLYQFQNNKNIESIKVYFQIIIESNLTLKKPLLALMQYDSQKSTFSPAYHKNTLFKSSDEIHSNNYETDKGYSI